MNTSRAGRAHATHEHEGRSGGRVAVARSSRAAAGGAAGTLAATRYRVIDVAVSRSIVAQLVEASPDVVVVDHSFGDFDVYRLCRDVRTSVGARILVVPSPAHHDDVAWIVGAIEAGADDVVSPSASPTLWTVRLFALMRLAPARLPATNQLVVGDVVVDIDGYSVFVDGDLVRVPTRQFDLLVALARRPNKVVSFNELLSEVWRVEPRSVNQRRVRVAASMLRRLLGSGVRRPRLETVACVGYRLTAPVP